MSNASIESSSQPTSTYAGRREIWAWAFYDFANSGYTTVVLTTIYSAYFVAVVAGSATTMSAGTATLLWTLSIAIANFCVLVSAPVVGAIADYRATKKKFLLFTTVCCVLSTALLAFAGPGQVVLGMALLILSAVAFSAGENLIAAFLPEITHSDNMGRVSGYGWSLGYFGGLLTLGICLAYINRASGQGYGAADYVPVTLLVTAAIFALAAAPTFLWLRERATPLPLPVGRSYIQIGFDQVCKTLASAAHHRDLFRFLACLTLYQSGVATVVVIAAIYAQEVMGFDTQQLIILIMVVNFTAAVGAFAFGFAQDRFGSVPTLAAGLLVWVAAIAVTFFADEPADLWFAGNLMGLAMGATQAGGRALIGQLTPVERSAEFFGLWGLASRAAAILGPLSYGIISQLSAGNHRFALLSTLAFFVGGLLLLLTVDEGRGRIARDQGDSTVVG
ncbi:MAG: MFS transporter [Gammaproteobacteria bacterium]|nr:MAG: MFS transporter [Gammaproteobacteria bacterium]RLA62414.1 MAG: MFS transporter [Gammaproteobacteria bacterium]